MFSPSKKAPSPLSKCPPGIEAKRYQKRTALAHDNHLIGLQPLGKCIVGGMNDDKTPPPATMSTNAFSVSFGQDAPL